MMTYACILYIKGNISFDGKEDLLDHVTHKENHSTLHGSGYKGWNAVKIGRAHV